MPPSRRAKQFAPFDALKGLKEAIAAKERKPAPRRELTEYAKEQVNKALTELRKGQQVTVVLCTMSSYLGVAFTACCGRIVVHALEN